MQAAPQLKVKWAESPILPGHANLWASFRKADSAGKMPARITGTAGNFDTAFKSAAKTVVGVVHVPVQRPQPDRPGLRGRRLQGHRRRRQGHGHRLLQHAEHLEHGHRGRRRRSASPDPNQVRIIYYEGSSSFGNGYHYLDIADSAALISKLAGAPVRLQLMRWDEQGWTRYGPAIMHDMRGGVDASGNIVAYEATAFAQASTNTPATRVIAIGDVPARSGLRRHERREPGPMYKVANNELGNQGFRLVSKTQTQAMGMFQNGTLRAPSGPQTTFASEQFIDMLAIAGGHGSVHVPAPEHARRTASGPRGEWPRYIGVLKAAVERVRLQAARARARSSRAATSSTAGAWRSGRTTTRTPRRVAHVYGRTKRRARSRSTTSGQVRTRASRSTPDLLMNQMSGSLIQGVSRVLHEELQFSKQRVTSRDWVSYPILRFKDAPKVTTVLVNRPDRDASGSGEPPLVPVGAAIANAIYDATGVRMTQAPLTPVRVRGFLNAAGK